MDQKRNYFSIGLFVFIGAFLFGLSIYALSSDEGIFSGKERVYSYFGDTQGLMFGSIVSFSGITVGNIKDINYDNQKKLLKVEYTVKKSFLPFIKTDSVAQLKTQGALGDRFLSISSGTAKTPSIKPGEEIPSRKADDIFGMIQDKIDGIPNLEKIGKKLEIFLDLLNSPEGIKGSTQELKETLAEAKKMLKGINSHSPPKYALKKLDSILKKIDSGQGTLGKLISDPSLFNKINRMLGGEQSTSDYLKEMARKSIEKNED